MYQCIWSLIRELSSACNGQASHTWISSAVFGSEILCTCDTDEVVSKFPCVVMKYMVEALSFEHRPVTQYRPPPSTGGS